MYKSICPPSARIPALRNGSATVMRMPIKPQPENDNGGNPVFNFRGLSRDFVDVQVTGFEGTLKCIPQYQPDDILYVRETWREAYKNAAFEYEYKSDLPRDTDEFSPFTWNPSIHMPREAARIFLRVTNVRVERLQDISIEDVWHEGIDVGDVPDENVQKLVSGVQNFDQLSDSKKREYFNQWARSHYIKCADKAKEANRAFIALWDSTVPKKDLDRYGWATNPWVWVYEIERCERPKDFLIA